MLCGWPDVLFVEMLLCCVLYVQTCCVTVMLFCVLCSTDVFRCCFFVLCFAFVQMVCLCY